MKKFFLKCIVVLCFVFFFALFSPEGKFVPAYAKEVSETADDSQAAEAQAEIKLRAKTKTLVKDTEYTLTVYNLSEDQKAIFKSSDLEIATVDENGVVLGISNGTATITVTVKEGRKTITTLTCEVTVGPPAINVKWTRTEIVLAEGGRTTLKTILLPFNTAESAKFYSADADIATVSSTGRITAKSVGTAYVFTLIDNGKYDFCKVTVVDEDTYQQLLEDPNFTPELLEPTSEPESDLTDPNETTDSAPVEITTEENPILP